MAGQSIDAVFDEIIKDCQAVATEAAKNAAKKVQDDVIKEAESYLQHYYNNYHPKKYKRTYQLKNSIVPVIEDSSGKNGISIEVGVEYDSSKLKGAYHSNSPWHQSGETWRSVADYSKFSSDNGIPQPDWILDNFLKGEHGGYQRDFNATYTLMMDFFDNQLPNKIDKYVQEELFNVITRRL